MKTIILCGGQGTRMREETEYRPKPLVEVGGHPILWHIMKTYAHYGFADFICCLGYRGAMIKDYFLSYEAMNSDFTMSLGARQSVEYHDGHNEQEFRVTLAETGLDTMTGGRIKRVERYIQDDCFMLTYGDGVADVDIGALVDFHRAHGRLASVTVTRPISRFGLLELDDSQAVSNFAEKPRVDGWASSGFFVLDRRVIDYLDGDECVFEREPMERLAREGQLMAFRHDGFFYAMDTYREYLHLNELWSSGAAPWKVW